MQFFLNSFLTTFSSYRKKHVLFLVWWHISEALFGRKWMKTLLKFQLKPLVFWITFNGFSFVSGFGAKEDPIPVAMLESREPLQRKLGRKEWKHKVFSYPIEGMLIILDVMVN